MYHSPTSTGVRDRFTSGLLASCAGVAQVVEHWIETPGVNGSTPFSRTNRPKRTAVPSARQQVSVVGVAQSAEQGILNPKVVGSIPTARTLRPLRRTSMIRSCGRSSRDRAAIS